MTSNITPVQPVPVDVLAEHYQKTFEMAYGYWQERNRLFVLLVLAAGVGLLLRLRVPTADALIVAAIAKFLGITDDAEQSHLQSSFPFYILLSGILVAMFYLMQRLYATNLAVMRNYQYLGALEVEIRRHLGVSAESVAFTREGSFYWTKRLIMQTVSKWSYIFVLFILLVPYMLMKLGDDLSSKNWLIFAVDLIVSLAIFLYWLEYAYSCIKLDTPKLPEDKKAV